MSRSTKKYAVLLALALILASFAGARAVQSIAADMSESARVFTEALTIVYARYVEPVTYRDLIYYALDGMLAHLDPHSAFMKPEELRELSVETRGVFDGLGIEITVRDNYIYIVSPIDGSPAADAGLLPGDYIVKIGDESTRGLPSTDAVKKLRGKAGTKVKIQVWRKGWTEPKPFELTRAPITVKTVRAKTLEKGYVYVRLSQFTQSSTDDMLAAIRELTKANGQIQGLVLDLRNNPGGLLDQAIGVADLFVDKGGIVTTRGRGPGQESTANASGTAPYKDMPMALLINAGSASASEIVAGCLQDHHRAVVIGERSFGKGSVQSIIPLSDGSGLRLTMAKYYTPAGRDIQAKGIEPDLRVPGEPWAGLDESRQKLIREADLERHLHGAGEPPMPGGGGDGPIVPEDQNKKESQLSTDPQLEMALHVLKAWPAFQKAAAPGK